MVYTVMRGFINNPKLLTVGGRANLTGVLSNIYIDDLIPLFIILKQLIILLTIFFICSLILSATLIYSLTEIPIFFIQNKRTIT